MGKFLEVDGLESIRAHRLIHFINPCDIKYIPVKDFKIDGLEERSAGGNWDVGLRLFSDTEVYQAYKAVFFDNKVWNDTKFFNGRLSTTGIVCETDRERYKVQRCQYLNFLYKSMREFGYVQDPLGDNVAILISRNGKIILNNGRHRLAAAQLLKIPQIPVTIDVRHKQWLKFKQSVTDYAEKHKGLLYAPINHVDLRRFPSRQQSRFEHIVAAMSPSTKTVVDLGAQWGHMCQHLEDVGKQCVAVEDSPIELSFMRKFRAIGEYKFEICHDDVVTFVLRMPKFDCVLALSIFHHLRAARLEALLRHLDTNEMFFQMPSEKEMKLDETKCINDILRFSCLDQCSEIGGFDDRKMFHFWRNNGRSR